MSFRDTVVLMRASDDTTSARPASDDYTSGKGAISRSILP
ncbi:hypothetical protein AKJ09_03823 [Labilithrix luteola]|uniref:Uncharacterized protein n=1 Tax=Labilithrix luteola TaxID=1391654 RepID=A0A0K1PVK7_9BACT|nr:hypothetical protein AKJ09_03823 [Labilithrix luteola]